MSNYYNYSTLSCESKQYPLFNVLQCRYMLTDFDNIWQRVYWDNTQHKRPHLRDVAALPWEKLIISFKHFGRFFSGSMWVVLKKNRFFDAEMRIQTWKWVLTADDWSDHSWQPCRQSSIWWSLPPPCWCVIVEALARWSAKRLSAVHHYCLGLWLKFMVLFQHGAQTW